MEIIEVKNNLVRIKFDTTLDNLILSGFVIVKDPNQSFIGQIVHLEANPKGNFAITKLLFTFNDDGVIANYNGSIPDLKSHLEVIPTQELLSILPVNRPIVLGEIAQQNTALKLDSSLFEDKLLILCEDEENKNNFIQNSALQLAQYGKKIIIFDLNGDLDFTPNKIIAGEDFKLPLSYDSINFIYSELDNASAEAKATIQEVFLEVQNYIKTLPEGFIPFETFKEVVDEQYSELGITELLLLKNRLLKYQENGIFAQDSQEFEIIEESLAQNNIVVIDLSTTEGKIQSEFIKFVYSTIEKSENSAHIILNVEDENSDKKLLKKIFTAKNIYTTLISSYTYKYLKEIKQLSKNLVLFAPLQQQTDFAAYNVFLDKLNDNEFIVFGQKTQNMPLIVKLEEISTPPQVQQTPVYEEMQTQEVLEQQIKQDVDEIYMGTKSQEETIQNEEFEELTPEEIEYEELTDEDLDLIENFQSETQNSFDEEASAFNVEILSDGDDEIIPVSQETEDDSENILKQLYQEPQNDEYSEPSASPFAQVMAEEGQKQDETLSKLDILPANLSSTPIVPVYSADIESSVQSDDIEKGDIVVHPKYGKGVVEKMISYGAKTLCSINFDNVGRRLLDPNLAELKKVE